MRRILSGLPLAIALTCASQAAEIQGVVADWNCTKGMVRNGREQTLQHKHGCSLAKNFRRRAYGLITEDKKYYRLEDPGNQHILQLLGGSPDKDNLKVIVRGDVQGDAIKVSNISIL